MKVLLAIVQAKDADACVSALLSAGHECTRLASAGGFLDKENATLLVGVADTEVDSAVGLINSKARRRNETVESLVGAADTIGGLIPPPMEVEVGGATIFVLDVERLERL